MSAEFQGLLAALPDPKNRDGWRAVCSPLYGCLELCRTISKDKSASATPVVTGAEMEGALVKICTVGM
jgi:hypothetical protein